MQAGSQFLKNNSLFVIYEFLFHCFKIKSHKCHLSNKNNKNYLYVQVTYL